VSLTPNPIPKGRGESDFKFKIYLEKIVNTRKNKIIFENNSSPLRGEIEWGFYYENSI